MRRLRIEVSQVCCQCPPDRIEGTVAHHRCHLEGISRNFLGHQAQPSQFLAASSDSRGAAASSIGDRRHARFRIQNSPGRCARYGRQLGPLGDRPAVDGKHPVAFAKTRQLGRRGRQHPTNHGGQARTVEHQPQRAQRILFQLLQVETSAVDSVHPDLPLRIDHLQLQDLLVQREAQNFPPQLRPGFDRLAIDRADRDALADPGNRRWSSGRWWPEARLELRDAAA
jgi:hypothetical protein